MQTWLVLVRDTCPLPILGGLRETGMDPNGPMLSLESRAILSVLLDCLRLQTALHRWVVGVIAGHCYDLQLERRDRP